MISDVIEELLQIAAAQDCNFPEDFKQKTIEGMTRPAEMNSTMYQDFTAKRPMEVETYLGSPIKLAQETGVSVPRIETLYALLHHCNIVNQQRPPAPPLSPNSVSGPTPPPRLSSAPPPRAPPHGYVNGNGMRGGRNPLMGPPMRRGAPSMNGYPPRTSNGYNPRGPPPHSLSSRPSFEGKPSMEGNDLEEFSHLVLYDDIPEGGVAPGYSDMGNGIVPSPSELALREKELMLRQRELQIREQEYNLKRGNRRPPPPSQRGGFEDDDDEDDDFVDPMAARGSRPHIDPENFDMMSVTSRRTRKAPSASQLRKDPEFGAGGRGGMRQSHTFGGFRPGTNRNRASARLMADVPGLHESLMDNPLMGYSSNRYANVDRKMIGDESRSNSLTAARLNELQGAGNNAGMHGAYPSPPMARRASQSPGNPFNPGGKAMGRPSPPNDGYMSPNGMAPNGMAPNGMMPNVMAPNGMQANGMHMNGMHMNGMQMNGGPSPPGMMREPVPRYPPGHGNAVAPQQVEQHAGVSNLYPPNGLPQKQMRSLTGSASASAGSGDSGTSAQIDSENSAQSSSSSLGPRVPVGVR